MLTYNETQKPRSTTLSIVRFLRKVLRTGVLQTVHVFSPYATCVLCLKTNINTPKHGGSKSFDHVTSYPCIFWITHPPPTTINPTPKTSSSRLSQKGNLRHAMLMVLCVCLCVRISSIQHLLRFINTAGLKLVLTPDLFLCEYRS